MSESRRPDYSRAAIHGTAWRYMTYFSGKLLVFVSTVFLARLLTQDDFGVVGYAVTAIAFLDVVSDLGVGPALIYHKEDQRTTTTAFWLNLGIGLTLFLIALVVAPLAGIYFRDPRAVPVIRVLALTFPLKALGDTHDSVLRKRLAFGTIFLPDFLKALSKGGVSILFALLGFNAWSLIIGQLSGTLIASLAFWIVTPWRPTFSFDTGIARSLLGYGLNIVGVDLLAVLLLNLDYLMVGRYLGAAALGVYTLAFRVPDLVILQFARILSSVIFPIYSRMRDVPGSMARGFFLTTRYVSLVTMPLGVGLALVARPFTLAVFTEKWAEAIPVIQAISMYALLLSLFYNAGSAYKAQGRPQVLTQLAIVRLVLLFPLLWWSVQVAGSIVAVGWSQAFVALISGVLSFYVASRLLKLDMKELFIALRPAAIAAMFMAVAVLLALAASRSFTPWPQLIVSVAVGGLTYLSAIWFLQRDVVMDASKKLRSALSRS